MRPSTAFYKFNYQQTRHPWEKCMVVSIESMESCVVFNFIADTATTWQMSQIDIWGDFFSPANISPQHFPMHQHILREKINLLKQSMRQMNKWVWKRRSNTMQKKKTATIIKGYGLACIYKYWCEHEREHTASSNVRLFGNRLFAAG